MPPPFDLAAPEQVHLREARGSGPYFSATPTTSPNAREMTVGSGTVAPYISRMRNDRAKYRRRRLGALFVVAALVFALYAGGGAGAESKTLAYTVTPGETLWEIAVKNTLPGEDPRLKVEAIREANDLSGSTIYPGMTLEVPPAV